MDDLMDVSGAFAGLGIEEDDVDGGISLLALTGELDFNSAPQLTRRFERSALIDHTGFVLDLSRLGFLDSSGLGALLVSLRAAESSGGRMAIVSTSRCNNRVFDVTRLRDVLGVVATREQAYAAVGTAG